MRLRGVSYGTQHRLVTGNFWQRSAGRLFSESMARRLGAQILSHSNKSPSLVVWVEHLRQGTTRRPTGGYTATPMIISDGEGTEFEQVGASTGSQSTNTLVEGFAFGAFPRSSRKVNITVKAFDYVSRDFHEVYFNVSSPAFVSSKTGELTSYPVLVEKDDLTFVLRGFHPMRRSGRNKDEAWMATRYQIVDARSPVNVWRVRAISVLDGNGGSYWPSAQGGLPEITRTNFEFRGGLSTNHPWTLRFHLANTAYASNELFVARDLPLPGRSERRFQPVSARLQGVTLTLTDIRSRNYVFAELSPKDENLQFELVKVVDDHGREAPPGVTGSQGGTNFHFGLNLEPEASAVDLTFALRRKRFIDVTARPQPTGSSTAP